MLPIFKGLSNWEEHYISLDTGNGSEGNDSEYLESSEDMFDGYRQWSVCYAQNECHNSYPLLYTKGETWNYSIPICFSIKVVLK